MLQKRAAKAEPIFTDLARILFIYIFKLIHSELHYVHSVLEELPV